MAVYGATASFEVAVIHGLGAAWTMEGTRDRPSSPGLRPPKSAAVCEGIPIFRGQPPRPGRLSRRGFLCPVELTRHDRCPLCLTLPLALNRCCKRRAESLDRLRIAPMQRGPGRQAEDLEHDVDLVSAQLGCRFKGRQGEVDAHVIERHAGGVPEFFNLRHLPPARRSHRLRRRLLLPTCAAQRHASHWAAVPHPTHASQSV